MNILKVETKGFADGLILERGIMSKGAGNIAQW